MSTIYETFPTQRNFLVQPTGAGGSSQIEYQGTQGTVNSLFQTTGTGTWTFQLPRPLQYQLQVGTQFTFQNLSTGLLTITADNGSTVGTVATGTQIQVTMKDVGNTSSSWAIVSSPSTAYSGVLPVANGGTGNSALITSPNPSQIPAYDSNAALHAKTFVDSVVDYTGSNINYTNSSLPAVTMIKAGGGSTAYQLPDEVTAVLGTRTRFINSSSTDNLTVLTLYGGLNVVPPGYLVDYEFIVDNTGGKAWLGYSRPITNISAGIPLSLDAPYKTSYQLNVPSAGFSSRGSGTNFRNLYTSGSNANIYEPGNVNAAYYLNQPAPMNYQMTFSSPRTTVINNWYYDPNFFTSPVVFLPDVSTIPLGTQFDFFFQNPNLGNVSVWTSKANTAYLPVQVQGLYNNNNNLRAVCISNDPAMQGNAWNFGVVPGIPNPFATLIEIAGVILSMLPAIADSVGKGLMALKVAAKDIETAGVDIFSATSSKIVGKQISNPIPIYSTAWPAGTFETEFVAPANTPLRVTDPFGDEFAIAGSSTGTTSALYANTWATVPPYQILSYGIVTHIV